MSTTHYSIELDIFSGRQNPIFEITKEDLASICEEILQLEKTDPVALFEGLGFRGFILSGPGIKIVAQKSIIKIKLAKVIEYRKTNPAIILRLIGLIKKYDKENTWQILVGKMINEYL